MSLRTSRCHAELISVSIITLIQILKQVQGDIYRIRDDKGKRKFREINFKQCYMARYSHLPVFQTIYNLILEIHKRVDGFPRVHRYSIGEKIKNIGFDLLDLIIKANSVREKAIYLQKAEDVLERLKIYIRLCFDLKILGNRGFEFLTRQIDEVGRQLNKWKEWAMKQK